MADAEGVTRKRAAVPPMLRCSATVTKAASSARSPPRIGELNSSDRSHPWRLSTSDHGNEATSEGSRCQCQFAAPREQRPDRMMLAWLDIRPSGIPHRETLSPPKISHSSRPGGTVWSGPVSGCLRACTPPSVRKPGDCRRPSRRRGGYQARFAVVDGGGSSRFRKPAPSSTSKATTGASRSLPRGCGSCC